jgi:hypothetical protein
MNADRQDQESDRIAVELLVGEANISSPSLSAGVMQM